LSVFLRLAFSNGAERPQKRRSRFLSAMDDSAFVLHPFFIFSSQSVLFT